MKTLKDVMIRRRDIKKESQSGVVKKCALINFTKFRNETIKSKVISAINLSIEIRRGENMMGGNSSTAFRPSSASPSEQKSFFIARLVTRTILIIVWTRSKPNSQTPRHYMLNGSGCILYWCIKFIAGKFNEKNLFMKMTTDKES
jgi:hypothetical protein